MSPDDAGRFDNVLQSDVPVPAWWTSREPQIYRRGERQRPVMSPWGLLE